MEKLFLFLENYSWLFSIVLVIIFLSRNWRHSIFKVAVALVLMHILLLESAMTSSSFGVFVYCFLIPNTIEAYKKFVSSKKT
jgi:MFS superfamily sulfate permease-like transporter